MQYKNSGYQNSFIQENAIQEQRIPEQLHIGTCNTRTAGTRTASYRNMQYNCEHGTYGQDCDLKCSVKCENQTCHSITGRCLSCPPGWRGDYCEQECEKGTYGQECAFNCSVKCENQTCDSITGRCLCCPPGWRGDCCEQDCEHGTYGQECAFNCSVKCENQTCDSITGRCLSCPPGWRGDYCEQDCEHGTYGQECAFNCSVKCDNQTCDSITGRCLRCPPGWRGDYCEQECIDTIFGPNCKQQCDPDCVPESTEIKRLCDAICGDSVLRSKILADPNAEDKKYQPLLQVHSPGEEGYINAVTLPSLYTQTKQFLTQLPMPTTVNDFWRLVTQYNVSLIVAFKSYEKDKSLAIYLPEEQGQPLQCGNIAVNVESVTTAPTWTEMKLTVKGKQTQEVTHLTFTERHIEPKNLLPFVQYARSLRTPDKSVVYTCRQVCW
ncbi:multiple epidermal growth factor-like domains protein 11 [Physella acuta]|uniref:multiple epidermal growth factor-like domains protein 11 n=1 Tax=Physella acuta TaxID=109671 RepID=UPI0027DC45D9|nr:multiple epidermal growth factor-like domains protein 11 [Physella acuta]